MKINTAYTFPIIHAHDEITSDINVVVFLRREKVGGKRNCLILDYYIQSGALMWGSHGENYTGQTKADIENDVYTLFENGYFDIPIDTLLELSDHLEEKLWADIESRKGE